MEKQPSSLHLSPSALDTAPAHDIMVTNPPSYGDVIGGTAAPYAADKAQPTQSAVIITESTTVTAEPGTFFFENCEHMFS